MTLKEIQDFRHTIKIYDSTKRIKQEDFDQIIEFMRSAPTSFNFQLGRTITISHSAEIMKDILDEKLSMFNSNLISTADRVLFMIIPSINKTIKADDEIVIEGAKYSAFQKSGLEISDIPEEEAKAVAIKLVSIMDELKMDSMGQWAAKQAYIQFAYATIAAASLKIDTTPMEGMNFELVKKLFIENNLMTEDEDVSVALAFGYRVDDKSFNKSSRKSKEWFSTELK